MKFFLNLLFKCFLYLFVVGTLFSYSFIALVKALPSSIKYCESGQNHYDKVFGYVACALHPYWTLVITIGLITGLFLILKKILKHSVLKIFLYTLIISIVSYFSIIFLGIDADLYKQYQSEIIGEVKKDSCYTVGMRKQIDRSYSLIDNYILLRESFSKSKDHICLTYKFY